MNNGKICISVCAADVGHLAADARNAREIADLIEIRLDCLNVFPEDLSSFNLDPQTIVTLRSSEQGGKSSIGPTERIDFWSKFRFKCGADLEPDVIGAAPDAISLRICSHHDFSGSICDLDEIYRRLSATIADVVKIAIAATDSCDALGVWKLLARAKADRRQIIPIAMGEAGIWTRILGLAHGAYLTYASLESGSETAPGQITARDMIDLYRVKDLNQQTDVYGIIAGDTSYTMSPYIHNAAFRAKGLNAVFVPFQVADLDAFITRMVRPETREVELNFRGFSVTNPHKQTMIKYLDHIDEAASKIGAVNTIKIVDGRLHGYNTDADGFIKPLKNSHSDLTGAKAAVVGAGGAARACIYSLLNEGATPTVFARNAKKATELAKSLGVEIKRLETDGSRPATDFSDFDIVVNTAPLGTRGEGVNETVATAEQLRGVKLVYDLVYNPTETLLMQEAKRAGAETLGGFDMLIAQAVRQFEMWAEMPAPVKEMSAAAKKRLYDS